MQFIKWFAIAIAAVILVPIAGCLGTVGYFAAAPSVTMSANDIEPGYKFQPGEREALIRACNKKYKDKDSCDCVADEAEASMSRFERLAMTAVFDNDFRRVVGYARGLIEAGIDQDDMNEINAQQKKRIGTTIRRCIPQQRASR